MNNLPNTCTATRQWHYIWCLLLASLLAFTPAVLRAEDRDTKLVLTPYLQIGTKENNLKTGQFLVIWAIEKHSANWQLFARRAGDPEWQEGKVTPGKSIITEAGQTIALYEGELPAFEGTYPANLDYKITSDNKDIYTGQIQMPPAPDSNKARFAIVGDCAKGSPGASKIAYEIYKTHPQYTVITGDIVYDQGRIGEYLSRYFPVLNAPSPSSKIGAPLLSSVLSFACVGNHDVWWGSHGYSGDFNKFPDALGYYLFWKLPLNGPEEASKFAPKLSGPQDLLDRFLITAGPRYPRMSNYSLDVGNAHWTVLDANNYMDWTNPDLRQWLEKDLQSAKDRTWKFVVFHHPPFNSHPAHFKEQYMRVICDILEKNNVDVVFNGHVHNYQRTAPLTFMPDKMLPPSPTSHQEPCPGKFSLDTHFNGKTHTTPKGIIYLVSGAGGANLNGGDILYHPSSWQPFTLKMIGDRHSFTDCQIDGNRLTIKQISEDGETLDSLTIDKASVKLKRHLKTPTKEMSTPALAN